MRIGHAIDLHATADASAEVTWERLRAQTLLAEAVGFDIVVVPDHLLYVAGGAGDYARSDAAVGVWESVAIAGALAAVTSSVDIGHSMVNLPYRPPALVANIAATLDAVSGGRYQLGLGSGNSFDYDAIGVDAGSRGERFAEGLEIVHGLLKRRRADVHGRHVSARGAELVLHGPRPAGPPIVVAAAGPASMRLAATYGDAWNGFAPPDPALTEVRRLLSRLREACADVGRDPATLRLTIDTGADPLDLRGGRQRSREVLAGLAEIGIDEARCYPASAGTHASRMAAIAAMADLVEDARARR